MKNFLLFFDWKMFFFGTEDAVFLSETFFRTIIMFIVILIGLTILGKRGVRQLSVFELVVIIGLGSAAGDPMFYKDVGILPPIIVFVVVISAYSAVTYLTGKYKKAEHLLEGKPVCLIRDGRFSLDNFDKENVAKDEFFAELRGHGVSQLGQVRMAIIETNGTISTFFYPDEKVLYGLPILPGVFDAVYTELQPKIHYACTHCAYTVQLETGGKINCPACNRAHWVEANNEVRMK